MHSHRIPNSDLTIAIRDRLNNLQDIWKPGVAAIQRRLHAHERALRLLIRATMVLGVVATTGLVFAWNATPSPQGLATWVHTQDTLHHAPYTTYAAINPTMDHALVAIEDERFYTHHGIDTIGLLRAAWDDLKARQFIEGGSTLTGQLAKNAYLQGNDRSVRAKIGGSDTGSENRATLFQITNSGVVFESGLFWRWRLWDWRCLSALFWGQPRSARCGAILVAGGVGAGPECV